MKNPLHLIPLCIALGFSLAYADYHYASHSGSSEYPYTSWETATDSITAAMRGAEPYDTVYIGAGDYNEAMSMSDADSCMTFIGAGMDSTHCWTDSLSAVWYFANRTSAQNIWFSQTRPRYCLCERTFGMTIIARNCRFVGDIGIWGEGDSVIVENCRFEEEEGAVDAAFGVNKLVFRNNYFYFNTDIQPTVFLYTNAAKVTIENNIFICNSGARAGSIMAGSGAADTIIYKNNYVDHFQWEFEIY